MYEISVVLHAVHGLTCNSMHRAVGELSVCNRQGHPSNHNKKGVTKMPLKGKDGCTEKTHEK